MATGFDQGADDYIAKPFHPLELIFRVKNVLRRSGKSQSVYRIATILDKGEYDYTLENRKSEEAYNTMSRKGLNIIMGILCGCWHLSE